MKDNSFFCYLPTEVWACQSRTTRNNAFIFNLIASSAEGERLYYSFVLAPSLKCSQLKEIAPSIPIALLFIYTNCRDSNLPEPASHASKSPCSQITGVKGTKAGQPYQADLQVFISLGWVTAALDVWWSLLALVLSGFKLSGSNPSNTALQPTMRCIPWAQETESSFQLKSHKPAAFHFLHLLLEAYRLVHVFGVFFSQLTLLFGSRDTVIIRRHLPLHMAQRYNFWQPQLSETVYPPNRTTSWCAVGSSSKTVSLWIDSLFLRLEK